MRPGTKAAVLLAAATLIAALPASPATAKEPAKAEGELLVNGSFESGDFVGWRIVRGRFLVTNHPKWKTVPGPSSGYYFLRGEKGSRCLLQQVVRVPPGAQGGAELSARLVGYKDVARIRLEILDDRLRPIAETESDGVTSPTWVERRIQLDLVEGAVFLRVTFDAERHDGSWCDGMADALSLRVIPPLTETLDPETGKKVAELPIGALSSRARDAGDPRVMRAAALALSGQGERGWLALGEAVTAVLAQGHGELAVVLTRQLADGDDDGRRAELRRIARAVPDSDVRDEALLLLAYRYPREKEFLENQLRTPGAVTAAFVAALGARGAPGLLLDRALDDPYVARPAYRALRERGVEVPAERLGLVAIELAEGAHAKSIADRTADRLHAAPDARLAAALVALLADEPGKRRDGAHLLLLRLSGRDLEPGDAEWKKWAAGFGPKSPLPRPGSLGSIRASILRGQRYLQTLLAGSGRVTSGHPVRGKYVRGTTALAVRSLLASGVDRDDPGIQRGMVETVFDGKQTAHTYTLFNQALASLAFDADGLRGRLRGIRDQMIGAQTAGGGWGTECSTRAKRAGPNIHSTSRVVHALAAMRAAGIQVPRRVFAQAEKELTARHWDDKRSHGWGHHKGKRPDFITTVDGFAALVTCRDVVHGGEAGAAPIVARGAFDVGNLLLTWKGFGNRSVLSYSSLERVCGMLAIESFSGLDWYVAGVEDLVATQDDDGAWNSANVPAPLRTSGTGAGRDTAYALLFLARATPQEVTARELTDVEVPRYGPAVHRLPEDADAPTDDFVRAWRFSDRIVPWLDRYHFPRVDDEALAAITRSAEEAPVVVSKNPTVSIADVKGGRCSNVAAYALRRIRCARATRVRIVYGSDNALRVWVNGDLAHHDIRASSSKPDQGVAELAFAAGDNTLLIEVAQYKDAWGLTLRFETLDGERLRLDEAGRLLPSHDAR